MGGNTGSTMFSIARCLKLISVLIVMLPLALCAADPSACGQSDHSVIKSEVAGINNYSRTCEATGFGGATGPSAMTTLDELGYRTVINLRLATVPLQKKQA